MILERRKKEKKKKKGKKRNIVGVWQNLATLETGDKRV